MASKNNNLKAFIRLDGNYQIVPSSLILQKNKPVVGNWKEINIYECCNKSTVCINKLISTQIWTTCNLNVSTYRNGDLIPEVTDFEEWASLTTGAWCYYGNNNINGVTYGKLYNWYALNDPRGLAPAGYHIPTNTEWDLLITFLGGSLVAGGKMKEIGTEHWLAPNVGATNSSGFTTLPAGYRLGGNGIFTGIYTTNIFWSATELDEYNAWFYDSANNRINTYKGLSYKTNGFSIRLIKD
jgi:uncharacterized protein (TIGR02145 family)